MNRPLTRKKILQLLKVEMPYLQKRFGVERIALYGSFAQDAHTDGSDVDLIVQLSAPLGLEFVALAEHLEEILGRKVDLVTFETLHRSLQVPRYREIALNIQRTLIYV